MDAKVDTPDAHVARIAARQHGMVSVVQLREQGLSDTAIRARVQAGRLHHVHRGVYAVGHVPRTFAARCMAAILACGEGAVVSRRSAAALWLLLDPHRGPVHVSVPGRNGRARREEILLHRCPSLTAEQTRAVDRIPVTSPARTISDLRREISPTELRRAVRQAEVRGLKIGLPRRLLATRSELEDRFLVLCREHRIPTPRVNVSVAGVEVDFLWPGGRLVVETDGYRYHRGHAAFEDDHQRDLRLRAAGYRPLRFTYRQLQSQPTQVADLIRRELGAGE